MATVENSEVSLLDRVEAPTIARVLAGVALLVNQAEQGRQASIQSRDDLGALEYYTERVEKLAVAFRILSDL